MTFIRSLLTLAAIGLGCATSASAAPPRRIPIADFFRDPQFASFAISPDGKRLAFLAPDHDRMNIWVCDAGAPLDSAKVVTHITECGITQFVWTMDSRWLLFSQDDAGREKFHLFRADPSAPGAVAFALTPVPGSQAEILHLPHDRPNIAYILWNQRDPHCMDFGILDIITGAYRVIVKDPFEPESSLFDPQGNNTATLNATRNGKLDIRVRSPIDGSNPVVATYGSDEDVKLWGLVGGQSILYLSSTHHSNTQRLSSLDAKTGEETIIDEDPEYDLDSATVSLRTQKLVAVTYEKERREIKALDPEFKRDLDQLKRIHKGDVAIVSGTDDEQKWVVSFRSPTEPGLIYLYDRATGVARFLTREWPWLKTEDLAEMKPIEFNSRDGLRLHGYLSLPPGVEPHGLPTVLVVHGGPTERDHWGYNPIVQFLANRGFAVLQINFRGSTGYGEKFHHAGDREWGGKMEDDLIDGAEWLVKEGIANPKRLGIFGESYGGYAALSALAFHPKVFACGVDLYGFSNLVTLLQTLMPNAGTGRNSIIQQVGDPEKDADFLRSRSPLFSADKIESPLFIAQGENDPRVKRAESDQMVEALKKNGKSVQYLVVPDEGHGFAKPENRVEVFEKVGAFLEKYLK